MENKNDELKHSDVAPLKNTSKESGRNLLKEYYGADTKQKDKKNGHRKPN